MLDGLEDDSLAVVEWHAPWVAACRNSTSELRHLASKNPRVAFLRINVEASLPNKYLAQEKVRR